MRVFFDPSALVKRYIEEKGSDQVESFFLQADSIVVSGICMPEIISAFARRRRESILNTVQYNQCKKSLVEDFTVFQICQLSDAVIKASISILEHSEIRAMDALHVACAIESKVALFVSSDKRQILAAKKFNLMVYLV